MDNFFFLRCSAKCYEWGNLGFNSSVAQLFHSAYEDFNVEQNTPYSELWMGTHPSGPCVIPSFNNINLLDWLIEHPNCLGSNILKYFKTPGLPFLFKVLSVRKALSIQAHPNKQKAEQLYEKFKEIYPDDNHKPEMAIALTEFKALCGFRPIAEIKSFIAELSQLQVAIGDDIALTFLKNENPTENIKLLKSVFTQLITREESFFQPLLADLVQLFKSDISLSDTCKTVKDLFLKLHSEYPGDIGCFCVFFLNFLTLKPGEAIFLAANEPHAYLYGDCVECMATSDNVVRAGLTPKFRDVETLCEILTYSCKSASENLFVARKSNDDACTLIYNPPVPEFAVDKIEISNKQIYEIKEMNSASLLIVIEGKSNIISNLKSDDINLSKGKVLFISSNTSLKLQVTSERMLMFRAYCSVES